MALCITALPHERCLFLQRLLEILGLFISICLCHTPPKSHLPIQYFPCSSALLCSRRSLVLLSFSAGIVWLLIACHGALGSLQPPGWGQGGWFNPRGAAGCPSWDLSCPALAASPSPALGSGSAQLHCFGSDAWEIQHFTQTLQPKSKLDLL